MAVDDLSTNTISKSEVFRTIFLSKGLQFPKSSSSILVLIYNYYNTIEELYPQISDVLHELKFTRRKRGQLYPSGLNSEMYMLS